MPKPALAIAWLASSETLVFEKRQTAGPGPDFIGKGCEQIDGGERLRLRRLPRPPLRQ